MTEKASKLKLSLPNLTRWDIITLFFVLLGIILCGASWQAAKGGGGLGGLTGLFVTAQLVIGLGSLMLLGKTAKEGTLWGNLAAVTGMLIGLSGVLLAAALWVAA